MQAALLGDVCLAMDGGSHVHTLDTGVEPCLFALIPTRTHDRLNSVVEDAGDARGARLLAASFVLRLGKSEPEPEVELEDTGGILGEGEEPLFPSL